MVQLFYYESRGKCARRLLRHDGRTSRVLLFPYEGWAQPASLSYWLLKTRWWCRSRCQVVELCGNRKSTTVAKMADTGGSGVCIVGKFKGAAQPDFKLNLSTSVSGADFQLGYSMTGTLERGCRREGRMEMTHFAMIKRKGY